MKYKTTRLLSVLLALVMLAGLLPIFSVPAYAGHSTEYIAINKVDQYGKPVKGAEFEIYYHPFVYVLDDSETIDGYSLEDLVKIGVPADTVACLRISPFSDELPPAELMGNGYHIDDESIDEGYWIRRYWYSSVEEALSVSESLWLFDTRQTTYGANGPYGDSTIIDVWADRFGDSELNYMRKIVESKVPDGYYAEQTEWIVNMNDDGDPNSHYMTIVNIKLPGIVTKAVGTLTADTDQIITDTVTLSDLTPGVEYTLTGKLMDKETESVICTSEPLTFKAENKGEVKEITFTFDATNLAGKELVVFQTLSWMEDGVERSVKHADYNDADQTVTVPEQLTGDLVVTKTVAGEGADQNKEFSFTVTLSDTSITGTYGDMKFTNGTAFFYLKHGESITISRLPAGTTYAVTESGNDGYKVYSSGDRGTIAANATSTAAFTNAKSSAPQTGDNGNPLLWLSIAGISGMGMLLTALFGRKRKGKHSSAR